MMRLKLFPWQHPPCWIITEAEVNAILRAGLIPACDGSGIDVSNCKPARLLKRMLRLGISVWHPNPLAAVDEARRAKRQRRKSAA